MATVTMVMPAMGESVMEATVLQWLKKEGEMVAEEESVLEVATDKVDSEVPALCSGRLHRVLVQAGEVVKIGAPLAIIATESTEEATATGETIQVVTSLTVAAQPAAVYTAQPQPSFEARFQQPTDGRFYSPLVRYIAEEEGMAPAELNQIPGTGKDNRVTKRDLLAYLHHRPKASGQYKATTVGLPIATGDEVIQLDRMRQMIAKRMVASKHIAPHVTSFVEADVAGLVQWREENKERFAQQTGVKLTYTSILLQAVVRAIQDFPMINAWVEQERIIKKKAINIGLAVALPDGNLIVPVIKHADQLSLAELAQRVEAVANKARNQQLAPDDLAGGTYTVSNLGSFQNLMGTPIIMQPQVAILALGAIIKKPAVVETPAGDVIGIRHKMYLSHSYDHRVVDGALGGGFVKRVADHLATFVSWVQE